ncbi:MAG: VWA domain-containing protein [Candidatus Latescibacteria bacterium]|jgi:Ca-activated chloride channel homolog|nr:VWA domain-containing protein [Candidatus Latescibacterota bacterium]
MAFNNPTGFWLLLILPGFLAAGALFTLLHKRDRGRFAIPELYNTLTRSISITKRRIRWILYTLGMLFLFIAITEPRFGTKTEIVNRMGVEIVIALDTSYSMLAEDLKPNRIEQAKYAIFHIINNLKGDRVALLAFAGKSFIQCPLTTDYGIAKTMLEYIDAGIIPEPGTNLGEAINGSIRLLEKGSEAGSESQIIILFTDGEHLTGDMKKATREAASKGIRIFTVGLGTPSGEIIPIRNEKGEIEDYKKDRSGNVVVTALDEETLEEIAYNTNGTYVRITHGEINMQGIIDQLGIMHKTDIYERKISRLKERYQIPLGVSLFFFLAWLMTGERRSRYSDYRLRETT